MSVKNDISMNYSEMSKLSYNVQRKQQEYEKMLNNLDALVQELNNEWAGNAQVEFATAYSKLKPKLKAVSNVLSNYSKAITDVMSCQEELDKSTASINRKTLYTPSF